MPICHDDRTQLFHMLMRVLEIPQIPSLGFWRGKGRTSERGPDSAVPHVRGILDERGRIVVLMDSQYGRERSPLLHDALRVGGAGGLVGWAGGRDAMASWRPQQHRGPARGLGWTWRRTDWNRRVGATPGAQLGDR